MTRLIFNTAFSRSMCCFSMAVTVIIAQPSAAQPLQDFVSDYNKPTKMQHMRLDKSAEPSGMNHYVVDPKKMSKKTDGDAENAEETSDTSGANKTAYLPDAQDVIAAPNVTPADAEPETPKEFVYKSSGVVLAEGEHFPALSSLSQWPWLKELTYGLENPATQNALQILDRDLSKASPLAMIWAAQHYFDAGQQDKALFLYLASRLRSSVDQARFTVIPRDDVSASDDNVELERSAGRVKSKNAAAHETYKDLSAYNAIAASIGRPILRYGLKNPEKYKIQLRGAMLWDAETPYEYAPSVNDLHVSEEGSENWPSIHSKVREAYGSQMLKIVSGASK